MKKTITTKKVASKPSPDNTEAVFLASGHTVKATGKRKANQYLAVSMDTKNRAYGATKEEAMRNLLSGIANRTI